MEIPEFVTLERARRLILDQLRVLPSEKVPLKYAGGRVLAEDIYAAGDIPSFDCSLMDGYAIRSEETREPGGERPLFRIIEELPAGHRPRRRLQPGTAAKIMTGAPIPERADAVVPFEMTFREGNNVEIKGLFLPGAHIYPAGEDFRKGEQALRKRSIVTCGAAGVLAAVGCAEPRLYCRPVVSIICIGDELIGMESPLAYGKIRNSNLYYLTAAVEEAGGIPLDLGVAPDDPKLLEERLQLALEQSDMVLTTGGASAGDYDFTKEAFQNIEAKVLFWRIAIRPGASVVGAVKGGKALLGLSGNPGAASISFELLARPLIRFLGGRERLYRPTVEGTITEPFPRKSPQRRMLKAIASWKSDLWQARKAAEGRAGILRSLADCNALIDIPAGTGPLAKGSRVKMMIIEEGWDEQ